jgi:hypothetical protein
MYTYIGSCLQQPKIVALARSDPYVASRGHIYNNASHLQGWDLNVQSSLKQSMIESCYFCDFLYQFSQWIYTIRVGNDSCWLKLKFIGDQSHTALAQQNTAKQWQMYHSIQWFWACNNRTTIIWEVLSSPASTPLIQIKYLFMNRNLSLNLSGLSWLASAKFPIRGWRCLTYTTSTEAVTSLRLKSPSNYLPPR